ncbi:MAG: hypothetical protein UR28_C0016G0024 [Candidatus Peregrinibacteria bacterium GW2011_GWF2_33_10]|nr:MAG: hypothetical protein UR28_C0016G0024 [Candidatus Peregrinibacteria bacterium GW2011_GWF2_33_10]OGJ45829.1 MAG: hypothetical protein A2263_03485 [Candidatus Peregrinibacteria bacterium RIFOXYA2_FULL_33_21]OGJ46793.1 MAG: hypothetical protein A2272_06100 [Candidatus Peregrinibacteria bacterium RIFOXYA12_FULL_33_12]OGJ51380.1 MAG: hypothetical protein A2307_02415 [Candidatus Peregrinibacteria bacterium RIFOXYB2_FULL_33_20]
MSIDNPKEETRRKMSLEQAESFVKENAFLVEDPSKSENVKSGCVDGRDIIENNEPTSMQGGSAGLLMAGIAILRSFGVEPTEKLIDDVIEVEGGIQNLGLHGDDHHNEEGKEYEGCGFCANCIKSVQAFNLTEKDILLILKLFERAKANGVNIKKLTGGHAEQAVFVVEAEMAGLRHISPDAEQVFVYQKTFAERKLTQLAKILYTENCQKLGVTQEAFIAKLIEIASQQLNEIVNRLAKGKSIYKAKLFCDDEGQLQFEISLSGEVPGESN